MCRFSVNCLELLEVSAVLGFCHTGLILSDKFVKKNSFNWLKPVLIFLKKATGLDNLPSKFLEISWADIFAPSLTFMFNLSICSGIVPIEWKLA